IDDAVSVDVRLARNTASAWAGTPSVDDRKQVGGIYDVIDACWCDVRRAGIQRQVEIELSTAGEVVVGHLDHVPGVRIQLDLVDGGIEAVAAVIVARDF